MWRAHHDFANKDCLPDPRAQLTFRRAEPAMSAGLVLLIMLF